MSLATKQHKQSSAELVPSVQFFLVTVSDTRTAENDENYRYLAAAIDDAGHSLAGYRLVKDEPTEIIAAFEMGLASPAQLILFNGGTGIAKRDCSYDVLIGRLEKQIEGFGELFRWLSYQEIGSAAMLSRAMSGICQQKVVFSLPGSPHAVRLAWDKLIAPEISHLVWLLH